RSDTNGRQEAVIRHEVGGLNVDGLARGVDHFDKTVLNLLQLLIRTARHDLHADRSRSGPLGEVTLRYVNIVGPRGRVPVQDELRLHLLDAGSVQPQVSVPPESEALAPSAIFIPDVEPADVADLPVNDDQLPMIPIIDARVQVTKARSEEGRRLPAPRAQRPE